MEDSTNTLSTGLGTVANDTYDYINNLQNNSIPIYDKVKLNDKPKNNYKPLILNSHENNTNKPLQIQ